MLRRTLLPLSYALLRLPSSYVLPLLTLSYARPRLPLSYALALWRYVGLGGVMWRYVA